MRDGEHKNTPRRIRHAGLCVYAHYIPFLILNPACGIRHGLFLCSQLWHFTPSAYKKGCTPVFLFVIKQQKYTTLYILWVLIAKTWQDIRYCYILLVLLLQLDFHWCEHRKFCNSTGKEKQNSLNFVYHIVCNVYPLKYMLNSDNK